MEKNVKVMLRMPVEIRERIAAMAARDHRSVNGQIVTILERAVKEDLKQQQEPANM